MAQRKSTRTSKAKAATAEANGRDNIKWHGLELELSEEVPLSFAFDLIEIEGADAAGNDLGSAVPLLRLLRSVLGPGQFAKVRNKLEQFDRKEQGEAFAEIVNAVFESYGVTPGGS